MCKTRIFGHVLFVLFHFPVVESETWDRVRGTTNLLRSSLKMESVYMFVSIVCRTFIWNIHRTRSLTSLWSYLNCFDTVSMTENHFLAFSKEGKDKYLISFIFVCVFDASTEHGTLPYWIQHFITSFEYTAEFIPIRPKYTCLLRLQYNHSDSMEWIFFFFSFSIQHLLLQIGHVFLFNYMNFNVDRIVKLIQCSNCVFLLSLSVSI